MPYKDPIKQKEYEKSRYLSRIGYWRQYRKEHKKPYTGSSLGYKGEEIALSVLNGSKKIIHPCDLSWEGKLVDVKTARPTRITNGGKNRWKFLLTQKPTADLFLLICKDFEDRVKWIYLIPSIEIKGKNISFNETTSIKYKKHLLTL